MDIKDYIVLDDTDEKTLYDDIAETKMFFFDSEGKPCDKENAVKFIAATYDKNGNRINETWGTCNSKKRVK